MIIEIQDKRSEPSTIVFGISIMEGLFV